MAQPQHHGSSEPQNRQQEQNPQNQEVRRRVRGARNADKPAGNSDSGKTGDSANNSGKTMRAKTPLDVAAKAKAVKAADEASSHTRKVAAKVVGKTKAKAETAEGAAEDLLQTRKVSTKAAKVKKTAVYAQKKAANAERKALTAEQRAAAAEKKALLRADTFTNAPKVSRDTLTPEEREEIAKHVKEGREEAKKLTKSSRSPIGRWWRKVQSSPDKVTLAMAIVTLGVVYGDIGTSPLYTVQTFLAGQGGLAKIDRPAVLGMLSLIFWTLLLITTVKYVLVAMHADNKGEGGIFALFSLVRHYGKWLLVPAMIGGAAFLADSVLTPAVSISSAVEGLKTIPALTNAFEENPNLTLMITLIIIVVLFCVQSRGTESIGKVFGSVVLVWFAFLALVGLVNLSGDWSIFAAINPVYGVEFLFSSHNVAGLSLMGTVFLSTTGAEALYSDMGHVGRGNIYFTWPFINVALVLNYFGQGAWMLNNRGDKSLAGMTVNPFFQMMSPNVRYIGVILSVAAGVIASQALITGAFTMVSEATGLNWMPHLQVRYPSRTRGQLYIPTVNVVLCVATLTVLAIFKDSEHISAAYGLALTITMLATTILLTTYVWHHHHRVGAVCFFALFATTDSLFFISSMSKFLRGGWFTMLLTAVILLIMITWDDGTKIERSQRRHMKPRDFKPTLAKLHDDFRIPYFADNIVYLTSDSELRRLDTDIFFSIFADHPKRARAWWAVSVVTTDEPFTREYSVENFGTDYIFRVRIRLGFKVSQSIPAYIHQIMHDLSASGELPEQKSVYPKVDADPDIGTVRYVLVHKALMPESKITGREALSLKMKYAIRHVAGSPVKWFGLAPYNPVVEVQPLFLSTRRPPRLKRVAFRKPRRSEPQEASMPQKSAAKDASDAGSVAKAAPKTASHKRPPVPKTASDKKPPTLKADSGTKAKTQVDAGAAK